MDRFGRRMRGDEDGAAMIIAVVLTGVIATLSALMLTVGSHADVATARGRSWVQSLHVAESGVEEAIAKLQASSGGYSGAFTGTTDEGNYSVTVAKGARSTYTIDSVGSVRQGKQLGASRHLRVTMAPPQIFKKALFSFTSIDTKNGDVISGDVWANQNVLLADGTVVTGSLTAATGYITMGNGAEADGDAQSGGFDSSTNYAIHLNGNATLGGSAKASVTNPPDPITCGGANQNNYQVRLDSGANIGAAVTTWGTVAGPGTVGGTITNNSCTPAPAAIALPVFTYNAANYDAATLHEFGSPSTASATAVSDFQTWLNTQPSKHIQGTFYVNQAAPLGQSNRIDLTGAVITGDTNIITNTPIFTNGTTDSTTNAVVVLASYYQPPTGSSCDLNKDNSECAVHLKNNFATSGATATLVYAPYGPVAVKNNAIQFGSIYSDSIEVKNNQELTYDARVERVVGFGSPQLEITKWLEV
jgi:hypothetical protein